MKHIFIVNPAAGSHDATDEVRLALENSGLDIDYEIYRTACSKDATDYVKKVCADKSETYRFYACGGDGTLNEVMCGALGNDNASITVYPCGSGNDFIKYYGKYDDFKDLENLVNGEDREIDILQANDRYSINVVHFGLDTDVLKTMIKVRRKPIIGGKNAYPTGVVHAVLFGMKTNCTVSVGGEVLGENKKMLLCTVANGKYVGGSYKCAPRSDNSDGFAEVCYVRPVSRFNFVRLMGSYTNGTHLEDERMKKYIEYRRGNEIEISSPDEDFCVSVDGELVYSKHFKVTVLPKAVRFTVPRSLVNVK